MGLLRKSNGQGVLVSELQKILGFFQGFKSPLRFFLSFMGFESVFVATPPPWKPPKKSAPWKNSIYSPFYFKHQTAVPKLWDSHKTIIAELPFTVPKIIFKYFLSHFFLGGGGPGGGRGEEWPRKAWNNHPVGLITINNEQIVRVTQNNLNSNFLTQLKAQKESQITAYPFWGL